MNKIERIIKEIQRLKKELVGYSAQEALDYIESYINILQKVPIDNNLKKVAITLAEEAYPKKIKTICGPLPGGEPFDIDDNIIPRQGFISGFNVGANYVLDEILDKTSRCITVKDAYEAFLECVEQLKK